MTFFDVSRQAGAMSGWPSDGKVIQRWTTPGSCTAPTRRLPAAAQDWNVDTSDERLRAPTGNWDPPASQTWQGSARGGERRSEWGRGNEERGNLTTGAETWGRRRNPPKLPPAAAPTSSSSSNQLSKSRLASGEDWDSHETGTSGGWISQNDDWSPAKFEDDSLKKGGREIYDEWMADSAGVSVILKVHV